ncbi:MAG: hypothetical protein MR051_03695 [Lentisphaeria bacterium]|nr:hypothetical protein [Lentisphaeria bacterium]
MSADWFNDRPLDLREVCVRLREAVEERERFFKLTTSATYYPLEIPPRPFRLSGYGASGTAQLPLPFANNLVRRIARLVDNSFDPRKFGAWSEFFPLNGAGAGIMNQATYPLFEELGIDGYAYCRAPLSRPFRWADMAFFHAAAEVLDRIVRYPRPPEFNDSGGRDRGRVFGIDAALHIVDFADGSRTDGTYQPAGRDLRRTLASGRAVSCHPRSGAYWRRNEGLYYADERHLYYDASADPAWGTDVRGAGVELTGEFTIRLHTRCGFFVSRYGAGTETWYEEYDQDLTIRPGGVCDVPRFPLWESTFAAWRTAPEESNILSREAGMTISAPLIRLTPENYPVLPYQYLS